MTLAGRQDNVAVYAQRMGRSTFVFAMPRWFEGLGRLVDLGSTFDAYNVAPSSETADAFAIAQDWAAVGDDIRAAMHSFGDISPRKR